MAQHKKQLPHLLVNNTASPTSYTRPPRAVNSVSGVPQRDRKAHADHLLKQLETIEQQTATDEATNGIYLTFEVVPSSEFHFQSLEYQKNGIELCAVNDKNGKTFATVFVPDGKLPHFFSKITQYQNEDSPSGKHPKNHILVASISEIKLAALEALWTDTLAFPETEQAIWWEVWLRRSAKADYLMLLRYHAKNLEMRVSEESIDFLDRTVVLVYATKQQLTQSIYVLGVIAELRAAKDKADFYTAMNALEQSAWINEAVQGLQIPADNCPRVCILDTGVNALHPLLKPVADMTDMHTYNPAWGTDDRRGHGTNMAGLAMYGDLTQVLSSSQTIALTHRLESVKIYPDYGSNDKELYGAITKESVARVEIEHPNATRTFCMAVTATDDRDRGQPSSWSASIDAISSGYDDEQQRLIIISAGNTDDEKRHDYPNNNITDQIHDPGQAWNALTVGAYTEKVSLNHEHIDAGWKNIAEFGDLSPSSCTSMNWDKAWPIKPDIVMEGGNQALSPYDGKVDYFDDGLQLLTTGHQITKKPLVSFGDTSAATALASQLAARVQAVYPEFWAETVRALLIHSAEWTVAMKKQFAPFKTKDKYRQLLRYCGYGVPNENKLFWSASNALTLIAQDSLQPYIKEKGKSTVQTNQLNLHKLPWPTDILLSLPLETQVEMKVTLSYFIEPNPSSRGHNYKYLYASHGLRFEVRRPLETLEQFQQRINQQAPRDKENSHSTVSDNGWLLGSNLRGLGSVHSDTWQGTAAELAQRGYIAVYPIAGWWKERPNLERWHKQARYALIVSITTPNIETDIYTAVVNQIQVNVTVDI